MKSDNLEAMTNGEWRHLLAAGIIVGSIDPRTIARYGSVSLDEAQSAIDAATREGVLVDGVIDSATEALLLADLSSQRTAEIHAEVARHLMTSGSRNVARAIEHASAAAQLQPFEDLVELADHRGGACLSLGEYDAARMLLEFASDMDLIREPEQHARRLHQRAAAHHGLGQVIEARELLAQAFNLAVYEDNTDHAVDLAVNYTFPVDWYAGDGRASAMLEQCSTMDLTEEHQVMVDAARALTEMRMPLPGQRWQQMAWITRPSVARPLATRALEASEGASPKVRLVALLAWRNTHRAPQYLALRRRYSAEALDIAQIERDPYAQVDAAIMLAADALQSGDRPLFDKALTMGRWVADTVGNPRLSWQVNCLAAGAALLDGDVEAAEEYRKEASQLGHRINAPGWIGADIMLRAEHLLDSGSFEEMRPWLDVRVSGPVLHPIGKTALAIAAGHLGDREAAESLLRQAIRQLDPETSVLLVGSLATEAAVTIGLDDVIDHLIDLLTPWADLVAVDSNVWWCDGPVAVRLAQLHLARGELSIAAELLERGLTTAQAINDVRSMKRVSSLRAQLEAAFTSSERPAPHHLESRPAATAGATALTLPDGTQLTPREHEVLVLMIRGLTNAAIARELSYSLSTIRLDTMSIYRKLKVRGRVEAVALVTGLRPDDDRTQV